MRMRSKNISIVLLLLAMTMAACSIGKPRITRLDFGSVAFGKPGLVSVPKIKKDTRKLKFREGDAFGYEMHYEANASMPAFILKIITKEPPASHRSFRLEAAEPGRYVYRKDTQLYTTTGKGAVLHYYNFTRGDPLGEWVFEFFLEGKLVKRIMVDVEK